MKTSGRALSFWSATILLLAPPNHHAFVTTPSQQKEKKVLSLSNSNWGNYGSSSSSPRSNHNRTPYNYNDASQQRRRSSVDIANSYLERVDTLIDRTETRRRPPAQLSQGVGNFAPYNYEQAVRKYKVRQNGRPRQWLESGMTTEEIVQASRQLIDEKKRQEKTALEIEEEEKNKDDPDAIPKPETRSGETKNSNLNSSSETIAPPEEKSIPTSLEPPSNSNQQSQDSSDTVPKKKMPRYPTYTMATRQRSVSPTSTPLRKAPPTTDTSTLRLEQYSRVQPEAPLRLDRYSRVVRDNRIAQFLQDHTTQQTSGSNSIWSETHREQSLAQARASVAQWGPNTASTKEEDSSKSNVAQKDTTDLGDSSNTISASEKPANHQMESAATTAEKGTDITGNDTTTEPAFQTDTSTPATSRRPRRTMESLEKASKRVIDVETVETVISRNVNDDFFYGTMRSPGFAARRNWTTEEPALDVEFVKTSNTTTSMGTSNVVEPAQPDTSSTTSDSADETKPWIGTGATTIADGNKMEQSGGAQVKEVLSGKPTEESAATTKLATENKIQADKKSVQVPSDTTSVVDSVGSVSTKPEPLSSAKSPSVQPSRTFSSRMASTQTPLVSNTMVVDKEEQQGTVKTKDSKETLATPKTKASQASRKDIAAPTSSNEVSNRSKTADQSDEATVPRKVQQSGPQQNAARADKTEPEPLPAKAKEASTAQRQPAATKSRAEKNVTIDKALATANAQEESVLGAGSLAGNDASGKATIDAEEKLGTVSLSEKDAVGSARSRAQKKATVEKAQAAANVEEESLLGTVSLSGTGSLGSNRSRVEKKVKIEAKAEPVLGTVSFSEKDVIESTRNRAEKKATIDKALAAAANVEEESSLGTISLSGQDAQAIIDEETTKTLNRVSTGSDEISTPLGTVSLTSKTSGGGVSESKVDEALKNKISLGRSKRELEDSTIEVNDLKEKMKSVGVKISDFASRFEESNNIRSAQLAAKRKRVVVRQERRSQADAAVFSLQAKKDVPPRTLQGVALMTAAFSTFVGNDPITTAAAVPVTAFLGLCRGGTGNVTRALGNIAMDCVETVNTMFDEQQGNIVEALVLTSRAAISTVQTAMKIYEQVQDELGMSRRKVPGIAKSSVPTTNCQPLEKEGTKASQSPTELSTSQPDSSSIDPSPHFISIVDTPLERKRVEQPIDQAMTKNSASGQEEELAPARIGLATIERPASEDKPFRKLEGDAKAEVNARALLAARLELERLKRP